MQINHLGMVGYGEVGKIITAGLCSQMQSVHVWDLKFVDAALKTGELKTEEQKNSERQHAQQAGFSTAASMQALCQASNFIVCAVTASQTLAVAQAAAAHIQAGSVFLDLNSASPGTKQAAAKLIEAAGAHYVEAGVMTSIPPYGIKVPMLLGGEKAASLAAQLIAFGMDAKAVSADIGIASAIKMCRSVMIKGMEALVIESYATARKFGVEDHVIPTLAETFPSIDWQQTGAYFFSRVVQHGKRRAEEMREAANTVKEAGFDPYMAAAIAQKHDWVAGLAQDGVFDGLPKSSVWQEYADRMIENLK
jgi:3-hydroxyisobutyrate dehydrogenase-like beta-hydroxyacid dehydrogenase